MAGDQPSSASPRPSHRRTLSTISLGKAAGGTGGQRQKAGKAHAVGKHNRNRSFGRDLNKLSKLTQNTHVEDGSVRPPAMGRTSSNPGQTPSSNTNVKRNKSDVALSRNGSKSHIKRNQSTATLRRNDSHPKLKRSSRPTTPGESKDEESQQKHVQPAFMIDDDEDDEEQEDEWTEESASVSPVVTRSGSMKGQRPKMQANGTQSGVTSPLKKDMSAESPTAPVVEHEKAMKKPIRRYDSSSSRLPDPTDITTRLLRRTSTQQLQPQLSTISAGGSSGTQSPSHGDSNGHLIDSQILSSPDANSAQPSMPSEGVSRFLDPAAASSSGKSRYASQMHEAVGKMRINGVRSRSTSPDSGADKLKRAQSAVQMNGKMTEKTVSDKIRREPLDSRHKGDPSYLSGEHQEADPRLYNVDPFYWRRSGGNLQAKMDLWRTEAHVEPNQQPPAPLLRGGRGYALEAQKHLTGEERKAKVAEEAEAELAYLRLYRNPAIESVERVRQSRKKNDKGKKKTSSAAGQSQRSNGVPAASVKPRTFTRRQKNSQDSNDTPTGSHDTTLAGSAGTQGKQRVRFEVGADGNNEHEHHDTLTEEARLATLVRSLWYGGQADNASVD